MAKQKAITGSFPINSMPEAQDVLFPASGNSTISIFSSNPDKPDSPLIHAVNGEYGLITETLQNGMLTINSYTKEKFETFSTPCSQYSSFAHPPLHKHNYSEIGLILDGVVCQRVEGHTVTQQAGQAFLMNRNVAHTEEFINDFHIAFLMLPENTISRIIQRDRVHHASHAFSNELMQFFLAEEQAASSDRMLLTFLPAVPFDSFSSRICTILDMILNEMEEHRPGFSDLCDGLILRLLSLLDDGQLYRKDVWKSGGKTPEVAFNVLTDYLIDHFGRFSRSELEANLHYSSGYLNKVCKMFTGQSLVKYGQYFSMREADRLLLETDLSITEIVERLGYANRHYFNQVFKSHFSVTPAAHRENRRQALLPPV